MCRGFFCGKKMQTYVHMYMLVYAPDISGTSHNKLIRLDAFAEGNGKTKGRGSGVKRGH